jgi:hypothetical protein
MSRRISSRSYCGRLALSRPNGCSTPLPVPGSRPKPLSPWSEAAATSRLLTSHRPWSIGRASAWPARRTPRSWSRTVNRSVSTMAPSTPCCAVSASCFSRTRRAASRSSIACCARAGALQSPLAPRPSGPTTVGSTRSLRAACLHSPRPRPAHSRSVTKRGCAPCSRERASEM